MKENKPIILTKKKPQDEGKPKIVELEDVRVRLVTKEIGEMIKKSRVKQELSQKDLAQKMNKNVAVVNTWEGGKAVYDEKTAKKFEEILKIKFK